MNPRDQPAGGQDSDRHDLLKSNQRHEQERGRDRERRVLLSAVVSFSGKIASTLVMLACVPIAHAHLSQDSFGVWMTLTSLLLLAQFADFGIGNAIVSLISECRNRGDTLAEAEIVSTAAVILSAVALIFGGGFLLLLPLVDWQKSFDITPTDSISLRAALATFAVCIAATVPASIGQKIQWAYQEVYAATYWQIFGNMVVLVLMLIASALSLGLPAMIFATTGGPLLALVSNTLHQFVSRRPLLRPKLSLFRVSAARHLLTAGGYWTVIQTLLFFSTGIDGVFVTWQFGARAMGPYGIMMRVMAGLTVATFFTIPLWPAFADALARNDVKWVTQIFKRVMRTCALVGCATGLAMLIFTRPAVSAWVGPTVTPEMSLVIPFAAWVFVYNVFAGVTALMGNSLLIRKMAQVIAVGAICTLALKYPLSRLLVLPGICWASVIGIGIATICGAIISRRTISGLQAAVPFPI